MPLCGLLLLAVTAPALAQDAPRAPEVAPEAPDVRPAPYGERFVWEERGGLGRRVAGVAVQPIPAGAWVAVDERGGVWLSEDEGGRWDNVIRPFGELEDEELPDDEAALLEAETRREEALDGAEPTEDVPDRIDPAALEEGVELPEPEQDDDALEEASVLAVDLANERADRSATLPVVWVDPRDPERVYVARSDGLWLSRSSGRTWDHVYAALPDDPAVTTFTYAPDGALVLGTTDGVRYTTDEGSTWIDFEDGTDGSLVAQVVAESGVLWAATDRGLFRSANGLVWDRVVLPGSEPVRAIVPDPAWDDGFWVASSAALYRTDDGGATFYVSGRQPLRGLRTLLHLDEPGHLLATSDDGVWESVDGGVAWTTADRRLGEPDVRTLVLGEGGPVAATPNGIWRMVPPREISRPTHRVEVLPLEDAIGVATHRDGMDVDLLSLARIGLAARFVPTLEVRFDWGTGARRLVDYVDADTADAFDDDWSASARLCWGNCSTTTVYVSQAGSTDYDPGETGLIVLDGAVYDEGDPVAAAANVAQSIRSYRRYLADHVADAWLARNRLVAEAGATKTLPLRDQVLHALQIEELDARLDALTNGAFSRSTSVSPKESP